MHSGNSFMLGPQPTDGNLVYLSQPMGLPMPCTVLLSSEPMPAFAPPAFFAAQPQPPMQMPARAVHVLPQPPMHGGAFTGRYAPPARQHTQHYPPAMAAHVVAGSSAPLVMMLPTMPAEEASDTTSLSYSRSHNPNICSLSGTPSSGSSTLHASCETRPFLGVRGFLAPAPLGSRIVPDLPTHTTVPPVAQPKPRWGTLPISV